MLRGASYMLLALLFWTGIQVAAQETRPAPSQFKDQLRLKLSDSSELVGNVTQQILIMKTRYGTLEIPMSEVLEITPGLNSRTQYRDKVTELIAQLSSDDFSSRDAAHKELETMGPSIKNMLKEALATADTESSARIKALLTTFEEILEENMDLDPEDQEGNTEVIPYDDTVVTKKFTVVGTIQTREYNFNSKYGELKITLSDIESVHREMTGREEQRRSFSLDAKHLIQRGMAFSGVRVKKGDTVIIKASGKITMPPWGPGMKSDPDGNARQFSTINIEGVQAPIGGLLGKVGSGQLFVAGTEHKFKAEKSGKLNFAIAMHPSYANNRSYNFVGTYKIKIIVKSAPSKP